MAQISLVIPAYNRGHTLDRTLDSVLAQSFDGWRAVIVDDGSTDATLSIASEYADRDPRITVHSQTNAGVSAARNRALGTVSTQWVLFLDADDWLAVDGLQRLLDTVAGEDLDLVHGRCARVLADGVQIVEPTAPDGEALFSVFARWCAFSIHTCLVRTSLVSAVGGFDESLQTCEDWDLWLRVTRTQPRQRAIPQVVAYYAIRADSASRAALPLMRDGSRVIELGHRDDPRMSGWPGELRSPVDPARAPAAKLYLATFAAGLASESGADPAPIIALAPAAQPGDLHGPAIALTLFQSMAEAKSQSPGSWWGADERYGHALGLIDAIADRAQDPSLVSTARGALEQLILAQSPTGRGQTLDELGTTAFGRWDIESTPPRMFTAPGVRHVTVDVQHAGVTLGQMTSAVVDRTVHPLVAADAVADQMAWEILGQFFSMTIYPSLRLQRIGEELRAWRGDVLVGVGRPVAGESEEQCLHRVAGWAVFLQELWGRPDLPPKAFYSDACEAASVTSFEPTFELSSPACVIRAPAGDEVIVQVSCGALPMMAIAFTPQDGSVSFGRIRHAVTEIGRMELCRIAVREGLIFASWEGSASLRERLRERARSRGSGRDQTGEADDDLWLAGRRPRGDFTGAASRTVAVPARLAADWVAAAEQDGQLVRRAPEGNHALYAPFLFDPRSVAHHVDLEAREVGRGLKRRVHGARRYLAPKLRAHFHPAGGAVVHTEPDSSTDQEATRVPILAYPRVARSRPSSSSKPSIDPTELDEHLAYLTETGTRTAWIEEWARAASKNHALPGRRILLSFDDADADFAELVVPLLSRYDMSAQLFVCSDDLSTGGSTGLSQGALSQLPTRLVRIGSGSRSNVPLTSLTSHQAMRTLLESRMILEHELRREVNSLAYPHGAFDGATRQLAIAAGYEFGYGRGDYSVSLRDDHLGLPRIRIQGGRGVSSLVEILGRAAD